VRRLLARVLLAQALLLPVPVLVQVQVPVPVPVPLPALLAPVLLLALGPNPPMGRRQEPTGPNCQSKTLTSQN
jgi:hypothetical protein